MVRESAHVYPRVFGRKLEVKLNGAISDVQFKPSLKLHGAISDVQFKPSVIVRIGNRGTFHVLFDARMIEAAACI